MSNLVTKVESSNLPAQAKTSIRRLYERVTASGGLTRAKGHVVEGAHAIRQYGESGITGAVLAAAHVELKHGLDINGKVPIDGLVAVAGMVGGVMLANEGVGADLRNVGAAGIATYSFRKTYDFLAEKKRAKGQQPGGKFAGEEDAPAGGDPIVNLARQLG